MQTGVAWYVGCPASGKTTLARAHAIRASAENHWPVLVIDSESVQQLAGFARARSVKAAIQSIWTRRESCAFMPHSSKQIEQLLRSCHSPGRVNLLVDEAHLWLSARSPVTATLLRLMRAHRHSKLRLFLTTQHLSGDVPQAALACSPRLFVFRCTSPATLDRLEREFGMDRLRISELPQWNYLQHFAGFST